MARSKKRAESGKRSKLGSAVSVRILILVLLAALGVQIYRMQGQLRAAQAEVERLSAQVEAAQQENDRLQEGIDQGGSRQEMEQIARDELGLVSPGERVFIDSGS